ncbi:MAG: pilus assembly protein PilC [Nitrospirae bacterium 13_1_40CM_62_7]|nr:MAG: pilus assembly protein PilC [Nitrospirae bacterium 13_1_40CM_62_7]OLC81777.1 MAG: pilus assembly protein PilC [Nitrospirae bacterium 13_1_40CM_3_62_11]
MATFTYVGKTKQGAVRKGDLTAKTREEAAEQLRRQNVIVSSLLEVKAPEGILQRLSLGGGVGDKEIAVFTRQFATMINAGLPLVQCLEILSTQTENKIFAKAIAEIKFDVEAGSTFADALKKHPKIFDELYVNLVHAGEVGGLLDTILGRLAKHIEKAMKLKSQIKSAMVYPSAIMGVAVIVITVLMIFVIPIFARMFLEMSGGKVGLPFATQMVIDVSNFMKSNILFLIMGAAALVYAIKRYYATPKGRLVMDRMFLKLPVMGDLIRKAAVAKFTRTLGTLITSGVPILEGLTITSKTAGNKVVEGAILMARQSISEGKTVAEPLAKSGVFPSMVTHMISVGEATGALDAMLGKIADFYDEEVDASVAALTALLEPMMMVFLGTIIGFIVIAMYLPIFKMAAAIE